MRFERAQFGPRRHSYYSAVHEPLICLIFLLPLLVFVHVGWARMDPADLGAAGREQVVVFGWVLRFIGLFAPPSPMLAGALLVTVLLIWHTLRNARPRLGRTLPGMLVESVLLAVPLLVITHMYFGFFEHAVAGATTQPLRAAPFTLALTAAIYEEAVFRLLLVWLLQLLLVQLLNLPRSPSMAAIVLVTAVLFAGFPYAEDAAFAWPAFLCRLFAGLHLGMVYVLRGFGITVGTHAAFNCAVLALGLGLPA